MKTLASIDSMYDRTPTAGHKILDERCPTGLKYHQIVYVSDEVQYCGEKAIPVGTPVIFTRYAYSKPIWTFPIYKNAFFLFPDGTERSLSVGSFTLYDPNLTLWQRVKLWWKKRNVFKSK